MKRKIRIIFFVLGLNHEIGESEFRFICVIFSILELQTNQYLGIYILFWCFLFWKMSSLKEYPISLSLNYIFIFLFLLLLSLNGQLSLSILTFPFRNWKGHKEKCRAITFYVLHADSVLYKTVWPQGKVKWAIIFYALHTFSLLYKTVMPQGKV